MQKVVNIWQSLKHPGEKILGHRDTFAMENRLFSLMCFVSMAVLAAFFVINALLGYWAICLLVAAVFMVEAVFYYFSRFRAVYRKNIVINGIVSYAALVAGYYFDSGINGPIIFLFFFTFHLLVAGTPNKLQPYWLAAHFLCLGTLMAVEYFWPHSITYLYKSKSERTIDVLSCYLVTLLFVFILARFQLNYYLREKAATIESQFKLKAFFESSPLSYVLLNSKLGVIYFNHTAAKFVSQAYNMQLTQGANILQFISPGYQNNFTTHFTNALNGQSHTEELRFNYSTLGQVWWQIYFAPVLSNNKQVIGVAVTYDNITERKEQEEKIQQKNLALTKIAFMQSHQLRQPVSSILGLIQLLKDDFQNNHEYLPYLEDAVTELNHRLHEIVDRPIVTFERD